MTIRDRIADWISGGALSSLLKTAQGFKELAVKRRHDRENLEYALSRIAALETPGANATVRKMARIAREALGE